MGPCLSQLAGYHHTACVACRRYVSELRAVFDGSEPPAPGTPQHRRLLELNASFRQLLNIFLSEATDTSR